MSKQKFELTSDLIKIEPEEIPVIQNTTSMQQNYQIKKIDEKEQINLKISSKIKKEFKIWCIKNMINMTDALEKAIQELIKK